MGKHLNVKRFLFEMVLIMTVIVLLFINNNHATVRVNTYTVVEQYAMPKHVEVVKRFERVTWDLTPYVGIFLKLTSKSGHTLQLRVNHSSSVACAQVGDQILILSRTGLLFGLLSQEVTPVNFTCSKEVAT